MMNTSSSESGRPITIVAFCSVDTPPTISIARVSRPVATAQKTRIHSGPSASASLRCEVKFAITSAPESAEVT